MVQFARQLYLDEKAAAAEGKIRKAVENKEAVSGLYLIALASNPAEQLDIFSDLMFRHAVLRGKDTKVVALAFGRTSAQQLVSEMAWDAYTKTGGCNLRAFLSEESE